MKKQIIFTGVATAMITPFKNGRVDYASFARLLERQIDAGIDAVVIGGTTGEAATLDDAERYTLFSYAKDICSGRTKLILGTGTNDTKIAVKHTEYASRLGCDGVLTVTPYYNKGTKRGIIEHYKKIAEASDVPVMLYNVPSRTGVNLSCEVLDELAKTENIVGIKEASDSSDRLIRLSLYKDRLYLYSGNDTQIYSVLSLGGLGVISVVSNLYPKETMDICKLFFAGKKNEALEKQQKLLPVINSLFLETNPAPIKLAMANRGLCDGEMRLPMHLPSEDVAKKIEDTLQNFEKTLAE